MATINGTTGNDNLTGTTGADTINGLGGNDSLLGADGNDSVLGGAGNDTVRGNNGNDWVEGGAGNDNVGGGSGQDSFVFREAGTANADVFNDFASNHDNLQLDAAFFTALGSAGRFAAGDARFWSSTTGAAHDADDRIILNSSTGQLWYDADGTGAGAAQLIGTLNTGATVISSDIWVFGTAGGGGGGNQTINGTSGNDSLVGGSGNDTINGFAGFDTIDGGAGADSMIGGDQDDIFIVDNVGDVVVEQDGGGSFDEIRTSVTYTLPAWVNNLTLTGTANINGNGNELDNVITGNSGFNGIFGAAGNDSISGGDGEDSLGGGDGNDTILGNEDEDRITGGLGNDWIDGGRGLDTIEGGAGDDTMLGGTHDDLFRMVPDFLSTGYSSGNDSIDGGEGFDWIDYHYEFGPNTFVRGITVDLAAGTAQDTGTIGTATIAGIEGVQGSYRADLIRGNGNANEIRGDSSGDTIAGGGGNDTLTGGDGGDRFIFDTAPAAGNADLVTDYNPTQDWEIVLDGLAHTGIGPSGFFQDNDVRFWSSTSGVAHDANDRVIYNTTTGQLWFDADGTGSGAAQLIATFQGAPNITASDIEVVNGSNAGAHIVGTNGNDSLVGTTGNDSIEGLAGNDTLDGIQGHDTLDGGTGNDTYFVYNYSEVLIDAGGIDTVIGKRFGVMDDGIENLTLRGTWDWGIEWSQVDGNALNNVITNESADFAMLSGGEGNDTLNGGSGGDRFFFGGNYGHDSVSGGAGGALDFQYGNPSAVVIDLRAGTATGGGTDGSGSVIFSGINEAIGGRGNDRIVGNDAQGFLSGYLGDDTVIGGAGNDHLEGDGQWNDHGEDGQGGNDQVFGGAGDDTFFETAGDDLLDGGTGNDWFFVSPGDFGGPQGNDTVIGGDGNDTLESVSGQFADLETGIFDYGDGTVATLSGIENLTVRFDSARILGSAAANFLSGGGNDTIEGRAGNDTLDGGFGSNDVLDGGAGNDSLIGGGGLDSFNFTVAPGAANADQIADFVSADDGIMLDGAVHASTGPSGTFSSSDVRFWSSGTGTAHDADDRVIYNTSNGQLWYDADGNGGVAAQLIATLQGAPTLSGADITIINGSGGGGGGSVINGTAGNDSLTGTTGTDTINGFAGQDTIDGGAGADSMVGGADPDLYFVDNVGDVIVEFENGGIDEVRSTIDYTLPDWVNNLTLVGSGAFNGTGNELDNVLTGNALGNVLTSGLGLDTLIGGDGNDTLWGVSSVQNNSDWAREADVLNGGLGDDEYVVDSGSDALSDAGGIDTVVAYDMSWTLGAGFENLEIHNDASESAFTGIGNELGNNIVASWAGSRLEGRGGNDTLTGGFGQGSNTLIGGDGNDFLGGFRTLDRLDGGAGNDTLSGGGDDIYVFSVAPGAANADFINDFASGTGKFELDGGVHANSGPSGNFASGDARFWSSSTGMAHDADDRVIYNASTNELWYDADGSGAGARQLIAHVGALSLVATDITIINGSGGGGGGSTINGTANADTLTGTAGNDTINGLGGNDAINASAGADVIDGGAGFDTIQYRTATSGIVANFGTGSITGGFAGASVSFSNVERVLGSDLNDQFIGSAGGQNLTGQGGADTLAGAGGVDTLWGGAGNDAFVFREMGTANADRVSDWASGADKLQLDDSAFTAIGALGNFAAGDGRFWAAAGATAGHDANDRVIFNSSTGSLYYDADGSGSGAAQLVATVQAGVAVAATDIVVI